MICISPSLTLPPLAVMVRYLSASEILIEARENYQKKTFRNKFYLHSPSGDIVFTIPLRKGKHQQCGITSVEIAYDENWMLKLDHMLKAGYANAPYYEHYIDSLMAIPRSSPHTLFELNMRWLDWILDKMKTKLTYRYTDEYHASYAGNYEDLRNQVSTGSSLFTQEYLAYEKNFWAQPNTPSSLSILDTLFYLGPETTAYLNSIEIYTVHLRP